MRARPENVDPAALHGHAGHGGLDGLAQAEVGVGDDQLRAARPRAVKLRRSAVQNALAVANGEVEDLAAVVAAHPGGQHRRLGDHPPVDPGPVRCLPRAVLGRRLAPVLMLTARDGVRDRVAAWTSAPTTTRFVRARRADQSQIAASEMNRKRLTDPCPWRDRRRPWQDLPLGFQISDPTAHPAQLLAFAAGQLPRIPLSTVAPVALDPAAQRLGAQSES